MCWCFLGLVPHSYVPSIVEALVCEQVCIFSTIRVQWCQQILIFLEEERVAGVWQLTLAGFTIERHNMSFITSLLGNSSILSVLIHRPQEDPWLYAPSLWCLIQWMSCCLFEINCFATVGSWDQLYEGLTACHALLRGAPSKTRLTCTWAPKLSFKWMGQ